MGEIIKRGTVYPSGALVALSLVICVVFGILLLFVLLHLPIVFSVFRRFTASYYPFCIFKLFLNNIKLYAIPLLCTVLCIILTLYKTTNNKTCTFILITIKWGNEAIEQIYTIINIYSGIGAFIYMYYTHMMCMMLHLFDDLWLDNIIPKNEERRQSNIWKSRE